jgi:glycine/D-amino acid oxidase-like deaminating enzyme
MVRCRIVVVAIDGALSDILPELADRVWPMRLQMLASGPHPAGLLPHAVGTRWGWDYAQQLRDGWIAFGGCRDVGGDAERTMDTEPTATVQGALDRRFREVTGAAPSVTHRWSATVGYTTDGLPLLEQVRPGIWATGGYSGTGNLLGAVCGRAAAQLALGVRQDSPLE